MAININGNNYGIAVDGNLTIEHVNFGFGGGVQSASGIHREELADSLRNYIFDTRLFDSDDKLKTLLGEIARSIDLGEYNAIYGPNEHGRINPSVKTNGIISLRPCWKLACAVNLWATKSLWSR